MQASFYWNMYYFFEFILNWLIDSLSIKLTMGRDASLPFLLQIHLAREP